MPGTANIATMWLIADVGATNSRCALYRQEEHRSTDINILRNDDYDSLERLLEHYLAALSERPLHGALALAAPILGDHVQMINRNWHFDRKQLARKLALNELLIVNDYHAVAHALPFLAHDDVHEVGRSTQYRDGTRAILGPGSGLGMAAWVQDGRSAAAMTGEGGHITMSARTENEEAIIRKLTAHFGHCSAERILSGPGIVALHRAMHGQDLTTPEQITTQTDDPLCAATMRQFFAFLGGVAADLALVCGALGGVYMAGGIVPACLDQIAASPFRDRFEDKNRYREYMQAIPTYVITDPTPGLTGLGCYIDYIA